MNTRGITAAILAAISIPFLVVGCGESADSRYESGYSDGYAEGYNTTLEIRATFVKGAWDDKEYSRGYREGRAEGVRDALKKKHESDD